MRHAKVEEEWRLKVLMPKGLATKLDAERASREGMSEAILRLAGEAMERPKPLPPR